MVELLSGFPLLIQQFNALLKKNFILTKRSKRSAALQLFSPLIFLLLLFVIQKGEKLASAPETILGGKVVDPPALVDPGIPACDAKFLLRRPCYDFVWSGDGSPKVENIVSAIMRNNPGRPISQDRVKSFRTPNEVDEWLFHNPMRCPSALHFVERNSTVISYGIQTNTSTILKRGEFESTQYLLQIPLQAAAEREIARSLLGDPNFIWTAGVKEFAHPADEVDSSLELYGSIFFNAMAMFGFVFQIGTLVAEKELKLRQAMSMMGLYESAYWLSWLTWDAMLMLVTSLLTVLFGMMFQFDFFLHNSFVILFLVFFLFQLSMVGFAFLLSTLISKSTAANAVGFSVFIISVICQIFDVYQMGFSRLVRGLWSLFPPNPFKQALNVLLQATSTPEKKGISWSKRKECEGCPIKIDDILLIFISTFSLWFILAIYLDNIIPNSNGVRKPVYYFLTPSYWMGTGGVEVKDTSVPSLKDVALDDEDVLAEETAVKEQASRAETDPDIAVQIRGLRKTYCRTIGGVPRSAPYHAVKGLWVNLPKNQLFCLLGPNGAGKTTAISCLTGITPVTGGDALIYGHSVRNSVGMSNIRKIMGVCPQFDILWDALSGREHLHLFSSIKGLPPSSIKEAVEKSLDEVKLGTAAQVRAGSYSGGMKRRLSVAIALIGDPKLVFLDEPSTGMDPISRRHVWDIIEAAKKGRAIVLTTHSMEEADILSDRIAIMAKGKLRCIGTSLRLKSRFGAGYVATVSLPGGDTETSEAQAVPVKQFFKHHLDVEPKEENDKFLTFVIPHQKESLLPDFFAELEDKEEELGISDIQICLTTLEEVFLNIAHQAELESSTAEGSLVTLDLSSGASIQIPKGARFVGIPGTKSPEAPRGRMVEVYWEHDTGDIVISGHSNEMPIPETVQLTAKPESPPIYEGGVPLGFVIDPKQLGKSQ